MLARYALLAPANDNFNLPAPVKLSIVEPVSPSICPSPAPPAWVAPSLPSPPPSPSAPLHLDRNEAIKRIKAALKARSGKSWSVTGGKGTAWGWIKIDTTPGTKGCTSKRTVSVAITSRRRSRTCHNPSPAGETRYLSGSYAARERKDSDDGNQPIDIR